MRYLLSEEFTKIGKMSGTVQNLSKICTLEMSATNVKGTGVLLLPMQKHSIQDTTVYLRCVEGWAEAGVVPFVLDMDTSGGGGSSPSSAADEPQVASDEDIDEMLDDIFG